MKSSPLSHRVVHKTKAPRTQPMREFREAEVVGMGKGYARARVSPKADRRGSSRSVFRLVGARNSAANDLEIVDGCKRGDRASWCALYHRYWWTVYRWVARLRIPASDRADVCQEVFLSIHRSIGGFRGQCQLPTWMFAIAARRAGTEWRRRQEQGELENLLLADSAETIADPFDSQDGGRVLRELLHRIAPKKRAVFIMFELRESEMSDIARSMGCSQDTAWSRLHHARAELLAAAEKRGLPCEPWWRRRD